MTIENAEAWAAGQWDWGILKGCFGQTKIEPTDIDGFIERKGKFLLLEAKSPGVELKVGQRITFEALRQTGHFTVIIVWGKTNEPERIELWTRKKQFAPYPADLGELRRLVAQWFEWADSNW